MLGDFCKCARTKSYRKPGDECARLCRSPNSAWRLERTFSQAIALADISYDLPKRWRSDSRLPFGKHFLHKILLTDNPAIRLPTVIQLGVPLADASIDKGRKALPRRSQSLAELSQYPIRGKPRQVLLSEISAVTAPRIGTGVTSQLRSHGIQMEVANQGQAVLILVDQESLEASLKYMARSPKSRIEKTCVAKRQVLHSPRQFEITNLQNKVEVIGHQAEGVDPVAETYDTFGEQSVEKAPIARGKEHVLLRVTAQDYVVQTARNVKSGFASHRTENT